MPKVHGNASSIPPAHPNLQLVDIHSLPSIVVTTMPTLSVQVGQVPSLSSPVAWSYSQDARSAANILTVAAQAAKRHYVSGIEAAIFDGVASTPGLSELPISLVDGSTTVWKALIAFNAARGAGTGKKDFVPAIQCGINATVSIQVGAAGPSTGSTANITGFTL